MKLPLFYFCAFFLGRGSSWGEYDPPDYAENLNKLMNISEVQSKAFLFSTWQLPDVTSNPSIHAWIYGSAYRSDSSTTKEYIISWLRYECLYKIVSYREGENISDVNSWDLDSDVKHFEIWDDHSGNSRSILLGAADIRIYEVDQRLRMIYVYGGNLQYLSSSELFYNSETDSVYILNRASNRLDIEHEMGIRQQKNWSPFEFSFGQVTDDLFIYSIHPHIIVYANESLDSGWRKASTVAQSEFKKTNDAPTWYNHQ
jgi:hypothetical protein